MITIGTTGVLKRSVLGNDKGTRGVCYETYNLGGTRVYSFIFPNGNYDGFGEDELDLFFYEDKFDDNSLYYNFTNVIHLSRDFENGTFNEVLGIV